MINSKKKGYDAEIDYRNLLRKVFGCKVERQFASGAFASAKGDMMTNTLPEVLRDYEAEVKYEAKFRLFDYIRQCQAHRTLTEMEYLNIPKEQLNKTGWHIAYRTPAKLNIPENFVIIMPAIEILGLLKELDDLRRNKK